MLILSEVTCSECILKIKPHVVEILPAKISLFIVNNKNRKKCEISSKLTIKVSVG